MSAEEAREKVAKYKDDIKVEGERVVNDVLPQRILEMNELLEQAPFTATDLRQFHSALHVAVPPPLHADGQPPPGNSASSCEKPLDIAGMVLVARRSALQTSGRARMSSSVSTALMPAISPDRR